MMSKLLQKGDVVTCGLFEITRLFIVKYYAASYVGSMTRLNVEL